jgi:sugar-specific transcriptional regulator TrmB
LVGRGWTSQEKVLKTLVDLGLARIDAKVYVFLAKKGPKKARDIDGFLRISKQQLYPSLRSLQSKGLVNATLEHPARFSAVPFEKALDLFAKAKMEEAKIITQSKNKILTDWQSIVIKEAEDKSAKFTIIEGRKYVYSKIQQMIQETKKQLSTVTTVPGLIRADQHGLLDAAFNHPPKSTVQFRFLTELSELNLDAINNLLKKAPKTGFNLKGRNPELGLKLSPRMVIRDNEELLFFITPPAEDDSCLWTTCKELVRSFTAVFDELWRNSTDIEKTISDIKKGETIKTQVFNNAETANKKYEEILNSAKEEIIALTSAEGLIDLRKKLPLLKNCAKKGIAIKIMAPITSKNLEVANQLSKHFQVKHAPVSYLKTTIVDGKHLFQSKATFEDKKTTPLHFQNSYYTNDYEYVENMEKILKNLWKTSRVPSTVTLESVINPPKSTLKTRSTRNPHQTFKRIHAPALVEEEKPSEKFTEKDIFNIHIKAQRFPNTNFSGGITRTYGDVGHAVIHPPSKLNLPELLFIFIHYEKYSRFGAEDVLQVLVGQKTPSGYGYLPIVFMADNPEALDFQKNALVGLFHKDKFQLTKKDEIQVQMHGNALFCGWTMEIPLTQKYTLPPGSILLEGYGDVKPNVLEMQYPSGYKLWNVYNGLDAFVTYFHPSSKYSGPGTDGFIFRDTVVEMHPP